MHAQGTLLELAVFSKANFKNEGMFSMIKPNKLSTKGYKHSSLIKKMAVIDNKYSSNIASISSFSAFCNSF
jgi:hypothetical protein